MADDRFDRSETGFVQSTQSGFAQPKAAKSVQAGSGQSEIKKFAQSVDRNSETAKSVHSGTGQSGTAKSVQAGVRKSGVRKSATVKDTRSVDRKSETYKTVYSREGSDGSSEGQHEARHEVRQEERHEVRQEVRHKVRQASTVPILQGSGIQKSLGGKQVLKNIDTTIYHGECFGIIGPNGSGKSTLVKLLSGADSEYEGEITYHQRKLSSYTRKQLARQIAVLQQEALPPIGFTVQEVIEMGRYPYQNWLGEDTEDSGSIIENIIRELDLGHLVDRPIDRLSGGERQRVALAKTAAQQPELLMLDEPTTYLDIGYQQQMMEYIRKWQQRSNLTVIAVLHDLNLAALYCDRIMVLHNGRVVETGTPEEVFREDLLEEVYGIRPAIVRHPVSGVPQILLPGSMD